MADQAAELTEIAHAAKRHWGYPEHYIEAWRVSLTIPPDMIATHAVWCLRSADAVAGFFVLIRVGASMELEHMWVRPEFIGAGIGRRLMEHALALAREAGVQRIDITSDPNAEGFYSRLGARRVGRVFAPVVGIVRHLPRMEMEVS